MEEVQREKFDTLKNFIPDDMDSERAIKKSREFEQKLRLQGINNFEDLY